MNIFHRMINWVDKGFGTNFSYDYSIKPRLLRGQVTEKEFLEEISKYGSKGKSLILKDAMQHAKQKELVELIQMEIKKQTLEEWDVSLPSEIVKGAFLYTEKPDLSDLISLTIEAIEKEDIYALIHLNHHLVEREDEGETYKNMRKITAEKIMFWDQKDDHSYSLEMRENAKKSFKEKDLEARIFKEEETTQQKRSEKQYSFNL